MVFEEHKIGGGAIVAEEKVQGAVESPQVWGSSGSDTSPWQCLECSLSGPVLAWEAAGQPRRNAHQLELMHSN